MFPQSFWLFYLIQGFWWIKYKTRWWKSVYQTQITLLQWTTGFKMPILHLCVEFQYFLVFLTHNELMTKRQIGNCQRMVTAFLSVFILNKAIVMILLWSVHLNSWLRAVFQLGEDLKCFVCNFILFRTRRISEANGCDGIVNVRESLYFCVLWQNAPIYIFFRHQVALV